MICVIYVCNCWTLESPIELMEGGEEDETIAMAVEMRCAITQPTIFSRRDEVAVGHCSRNR